MDENKQIDEHDQKEQKTFGARYLLRKGFDPPVLLATYDGIQLVENSDVAFDGSEIHTTDWQWTPDGKRLQNTPSLFFLRVWCKNPESLRQQGFEVCGARDGAADVWWVYLRPSESLRGYVSMEY